MLDTIRGAATQRHPGDDEGRRRALLTQLDRLQDLYVLGDLTKPRYIMRRQTLEEELQRLAPPTDPDLDRAQALLGDFAHFWHAEPKPAERRKLLASPFDHVWQDNGTVVAVKPRPAFAGYFKAIDQARPKPPKADRKRGVTKAGATGVCPGLCPPTHVTISRSGLNRRMLRARSALLSAASRLVMEVRALLLVQGRNARRSANATASAEKSSSRQRPS